MEVDPEPTDTSRRRRSVAFVLGWGSLALIALSAVPTIVGMAQHCLSDQDTLGMSPFLMQMVLSIVPAILFAVGGIAALVNASRPSGLGQAILGVFISLALGLGLHYAAYFATGCPHEAPGNVNTNGERLRGCDIVPCADPE